MPTKGAAVEVCQLCAAPHTTTYPCIWCHCCESMEVLHVASPPPLASDGVCSGMVYWLIGQSTLKKISLGSSGLVAVAVL